MTEVLVLSDIHYASAAEQGRHDHETRALANPFLRCAVRCYRRYVWLHRPLAQNHFLDAVLAQAGEPDLVIANGDYSCDTAFVGVSDSAARASADECLRRLRDRFPDRLRTVIGDHELGKFSIFGRQGGLRLASWRVATRELGLEPFWRVDLGRYTLLGVTSSLLGLPVLEPEALAEELPGWRELREEHLSLVRRALNSLTPDRRLLLFCHDPTALPFLAREPAMDARFGQLEGTVIGHLHSDLIFRPSYWLAGMPAVRWLGNTVRRLSEALSEARDWRRFRLKLCPSLTGTQLLKDGGFLRLSLDTQGNAPWQVGRHFLPWRPTH